MVNARFGTSRRSTTAAPTIPSQRRCQHFHSSIPCFIVVLVTIIFICQKSCFCYNVNAFTTIQQQQQQQQQQQNDSPSNHVPTNHQQQFIQHHRSLSSAITTNNPFKVATSAVSMDSFTSPTSRSTGNTIPPILSTSTSSKTISSTSSSASDSQDKNVVLTLPSLGFGSGGVAVVTPFTKEQEAIAKYHYYQQMMQLAEDDDDEDDDEELMGLGTALITCALSLVIGFGLGYGT